MRKVRWTYSHEVPAVAKYWAASAQTGANNVRIVLDWAVVRYKFNWQTYVYNVHTGEKAGPYKLLSEAKNAAIILHSMEVT